jgi:hypothetical protein
MMLAPAPPASSCTAAGAGAAALGTSPGMSTMILSPDTAYALTVNDQGVLSVAPKQLHGQHPGPAGGAGPELNCGVEQPARRLLRAQDPAHQRQPPRAFLHLVRPLAPSVPAGVAQWAVHGRGEPGGGAAGAGQRQQGGGVEPAGRHTRARTSYFLHPQHRGAAAARQVW